MVRKGIHPDWCRGFSARPAQDVVGLLCVQVPGSTESVLCEHGNRMVTRMEKDGTKTVLATHFNVSSVSNLGSNALGRFTVFEGGSSGGPTLGCTLQRSDQQCWIVTFVMTDVGTCRRL